VAAALRQGFGALAEAPLSPWFDEEGIHLVYYDRRARRVAVVGDFNDWDPEAHRMQNTRPWQWQLTLPSLPPGRYHYKFLIDNEAWVDDPENVEKEADGYGGFNAVLVVS
jgi:1,4-alpha-glucan branching enzyme